MKNMNLALKIARENRCKFKFGCVITAKGGSVIAEAQNNMIKTHPLQSRYAQRVGLKRKIYLHAEIAALTRCREKPEKIYIARILKNGRVAIAKPCRICRAAIVESGIKEIHYTNENGKITTERI